MLVAPNIMVGPTPKTKADFQALRNCNVWAIVSVGTHVASGCFKIENCLCKKNETPDEDELEEALSVLRISVTTKHLRDAKEQSPCVAYICGPQQQIYLLITCFRWECLGRTSEVTIDALINTAQFECKTNELFSEKQLGWLRERYK